MRALLVVALVAAALLAAPPPAQAYVCSLADPAHFAACATACTRSSLEAFLASGDPGDLLFRVCPA